MDIYHISARDESCRLSDVISIRGYLCDIWGQRYHRYEGAPLHPAVQLYVESFLEINHTMVIPYFVDDSRQRGVTNLAVAFQVFELVERLSVSERETGVLPCHPYLLGLIVVIVIEYHPAVGFIIIETPRAGLAGELGARGR